MEDPRLVTTMILSEYHYSPYALPIDQINVVVRDFVQQDESLLARWQIAFGGTTQPYDHPLKAFLLLDHAGQVRGTHAFVAQTALSLESDDPKAAKAMRCLFDLDVPRGHALWWKRHMQMVEAPRTRAWARHIHQVIERHPETPLLVICGATHVAELRSILAGSKASLWDNRPAQSRPQQGHTFMSTADNPMH